MKKISSFFLLIFLSVLLASPQMATRADASNISERGQIAIEQIATCVNSDGKNALNVAYLIDESGSLKWNDPKNLRVQGLIRSLEQFRDVSVSKPYFTVNRVLATFGNKFTVQKDWEKLDNGQLKSDLDWISETVPKLVEGQSTDWTLGIKGILNEFKKVQGSNTCNVLVWFTDGGVQVQNDVKTESSLSELCGVNPVTGQKTGKIGLVDELRKNGINIQGVLLQNQAYFENPKAANPKSSPESAAIEKARMSFFLPVIEQAGTVLQGAFISSGGVSSFQCGTYSGAGGVLQVVTDPLDIIWPPIQFSCLANNGRVLPVAGGKVKVDAALTRFTVTSPIKNFALKNGDGTEIANREGTSKGDVSTKLIGSSSSIIEVSGKISDVNSVTKPGVWSISSSDLGRVVFCGFLDLGIDLKVGTCYVGETCDYSGQITRFGRAVDQTNFRSIRATSALVTEQGNVGTPTALNIDVQNSTFQGSITPPGNSNFTNLKITLKVVTETGIEFSLGTIKPIRVIPAGNYPELTPSPINITDFTQGLIGRSGVAQASLKLKAPSRTNGEICLAALEVRSDVNPNRINGYVSKVDGKDLKDNPCFQLQAGSEQIAALEISNSDSADGAVSGYISAVLKADGQPDIETKVDIQFETSTLTDGGLIYRLSLLMFLGLAIPLGVLAYINSRNSRIVLDNIYRASIPVTLTSAGNFVTPSRVEKGKTSDLLSHEDFLPFSSGKEVVRSKQIGSEILSGKAPINPFGNLRSTITTSPGQVIASSAFGSGKSKFQSNQAYGALNPSGLVYVTLSGPATALLKAQNQGESENNEKIEGNLTALLSLNTGDPTAQVDYLNTRIMHEGGWLNNLLNTSEVAPVASKVKNPKKSKRNKKETLVVPPEADDWGSPDSNSAANSIAPERNSAKSNPSNVKPAADEWGTTAQQSDWGSTDPSNNSGTKEEW
jgi:hypothetical protein